MGLMEESRKKEIKKHVATIHCSNTLGLLQRKVSNVLLFHAYPHLKTVEEHHITVKQLCCAIDYVGHNTAAVKEALKGLISTVIEWDVFDDITGEEDWTASSILSSVRIKGSSCWYSYSPRMRELLHSPSIYAKINLIIQSKFKSNYGLALYENCVRYQSLPYTKWFDLDVFRKLMGVSAESYKIFRDFKRRVLDKAIEEVNYYSDMYVVPEIDRVGHKVSRIRFKLNEKTKKKWLGVERKSSLKSSLTDSLINEYKLTTDQVETLIEKYGTDKLVSKIEYIRDSKSYQMGKISNFAGYLVQALKEDYQKPHEVTVNQNSEIKESQDKIEAQKQDLLKKQYNEYVMKKLDNVLNHLNSESRIQLVTDFENYLKLHSILYFKKYQKQGLNNKVIKAHLNQFIDKNYPALKENMMNFDTFVLNQKETL